MRIIDVSWGRPKLTAWDTGTIFAFLSNENQTGSNEIFASKANFGISTTIRHYPRGVDNMLIVEPDGLSQFGKIHSKQNEMSDRHHR